MERMNGGATREERSPEKEAIDWRRISKLDTIKSKRTVRKAAYSEERCPGTLVLGFGGRGHIFQGMRHFESVIE